ncbi:MAG: hypothetical protein ACLVA8_08200 [Faecalibacterium prausnitzii]|jgi:hypothetical protein
MGRKSKGELPRWLTASPDQKEKRFVQVGNTLLFDRRFTALSVGARYFYILAANESGGQRSFQFPASKMEALGISKRTGWNYLKELEAAGFIECIKSGKCARQPNDYQFSFQWLEPP